MNLGMGLPISRLGSDPEPKSVAISPDDGEVRQLEQEAYELGQKHGDYWSWAEKRKFYSISRGYYRFSRKDWARIENAFKKGGGDLEQYGGHDDLSPDEKRDRDAVGTDVGN